MTTHSKTFSMAMNRIEELSKQVATLEQDNLKLVSRLNNRNAHAFSLEMERVKISEQLLDMGFLLDANGKILKR